MRCRSMWKISDASSNTHTAYSAADRLPSSLGSLPLVWQRRQQHHRGCPRAGPPGGNSQTSGARSCCFYRPKYHQLSMLAATRPRCATASCAASAAYCVPRPNSDRGSPCSGQGPLPLSRSRLPADGSQTLVIATRLGEREEKQRFVSRYHRGLILVLLVSRMYGQRARRDAMDEGQALQNYDSSARQRLIVAAPARRLVHHSNGTYTDWGRPELDTDGVVKRRASSRSRSRRSAHKHAGNQPPAPAQS